eukprot:ANDGO_04492.mRNA.1 hypothetical protein
MSLLEGTFLLYAGENEYETVDAVLSSTALILRLSAAPTDCISIALGPFFTVLATQIPQLPGPMPKSPASLGPSMKISSAIEIVTPETSVLLCETGDSHELHTTWTLFLTQASVLVTQSLFPLSSEHLFLWFSPPEEALFDVLSAAKKERGIPEDVAVLLTQFNVSLVRLSLVPRTAEQNRRSLIVLNPYNGKELYGFFGSSSGGGAVTETRAGTRTGIGDDIAVEEVSIVELSGSAVSVVVNDSELFAAFDEKARSRLLKEFYGQERKRREAVTRDRTDTTKRASITGRSAEIANGSLVFGERFSFSNSGSNSTASSSESGSIANSRPSSRQDSGRPAAAASVNSRVSFAEEVQVIPERTAPIAATSETVTDSMDWKVECVKLLTKVQVLSDENAVLVTQVSAMRGQLNEAHNRIRELELKIAQNSTGVHQHRDAPLSMNHHDCQLPQQQLQHGTESAQRTLSRSNSLTQSSDSPSTFSPKSRFLAKK